MDNQTPASGAATPMPPPGMLTRNRKAQLDAVLSDTRTPAHTPSDPIERADSVADAVVRRRSEEQKQLRREKKARQYTGRPTTPTTAGGSSSGSEASGDENITVAPITDTAAPVTSEPDMTGTASLAVPTQELTPGGTVTADNPASPETEHQTAHPAGVGLPLADRRVGVPGVIDAPVWNGRVEAATEELVQATVKNVNMGPYLGHVGPMTQVALLTAITEGATANILSNITLVPTLPIDRVNKTEETRRAARREFVAGATQRQSSSDQATSGDEPVGGPPGRRVRRQISLTEAAGRFAIRMLHGQDSLKRILGFLITGKNNEPFTAAVSYVLERRWAQGRFTQEGISKAESDLVLVVVKQWARKHEHTQDMRDKLDEVLQTGTGAREAVQGLQGTARQVLEDLETVTAQPDNIRVREIGEALLRIRPFASLLVKRRVCVYCAASQFLMTGATDLPEPEGVESDQTFFPEFSAFQHALIDGSHRAAQELAKQHNREMHAENGNIFYNTENGTSRIQSLAGGAEKAMSQNRYPHVYRQEPRIKLGYVETEVPSLSYSTSSSAGIDLNSTPPTRHQIAWYADTLANDVPVRTFEAQVHAPATADNEPVLQLHPSPLGSESVSKSKTSSSNKSTMHTATASSFADPPDQFDGYGEYTPVPYRTGVRRIRSWRKAHITRNRQYPIDWEAHRQTMHELAEGGDHRFGNGGVLLMGCTEAFEEEPERFNGVDIPHLRFVNERQLTWIGVGGDAVFNQDTATLTAGAVDIATVVADPTTKDGRINAKLPSYIHRYIADAPLFHNVLADATKTLRADLTSHLVKLRLYDHLREWSTGFPTGTEWGVPVKARVHRNVVVREEVDDTWQAVFVTANYLDQRLHLNEPSIAVEEGVWALDDPTVAVIVLDYTAPSASLIWNLQILMAAPYPLIDVEEYFICTGPGGSNDLRFTGMKRYEAYITMENHRRKFVFVSTTNRASIMLNNVEYGVTQLGQHRIAGPAFIHPMRDIIEEALDRVIMTAHPLSQAIIPWLDARTVAHNPDWARIDDIINALVWRFVPQPEITRKCVEKYNETEHTVTKFAPKYLMEGEDFNTLPPELKLQCTKEDLKRDRQLAFENTLRSHNYIKKIFDQQRKEYKLDVGDRVYVENINRINRKKMDELRIGPYKILRKISNSIYKVDTGHRKAESNLYHITKLTPVLVDE